MLTQFDYNQEPTSCLLSVGERLLSTFISADIEGQERFEQFKKLSSFYALLLRMDISLVEPHLKLRAPMITRQAYSSLKEYCSELGNIGLINQQKDFEIEWEGLKQQYELLFIKSELPMEKEVYGTFQKNCLRFADSIITETLYLSLVEMMNDLDEISCFEQSDLKACQNHCVSTLDAVASDPAVLMLIAPKLTYFTDLVYSPGLETSLSVSLLWELCSSVKYQAHLATKGLLSAELQSILTVSLPTKKENQTISVIKLTGKPKVTLAADAETSLFDFDFDDTEDLPSPQLDHYNIFITKYFIKPTINEDILYRIGMRIERVDNLPIEAIKVVGRKKGNDEEVILLPIGSDQNGLFIDYELTHFIRVILSSEQQGKITELSFILDKL